MIVVFTLFEVDYMYSFSFHTFHTWGDRFWFPPLGPVCCCQFLPSQTSLSVSWPRHLPSLQRSWQQVLKIYILQQNTIECLKYLAGVIIPKRKFPRNIGFFLSFKLNTRDLTWFLYFIGLLWSLLISSSNIVAKSSHLANRVLW